MKHVKSKINSIRRKGDGDKELGKEAMTIYKRIKNRIKEEVNFESPSAKRR